MYDVWYCSGCGMPNSVFDCVCYFCKVPKPFSMKNRIKHVIQGGFAQ